jgi:hypothetical protein
VVRLVPDAVAIDAALEVLRRDLREVAEVARARLVVADLAAIAGGPARRVAGQRELDLDAARAGCRDQVVPAAEVVGDAARRLLALRPLGGGRGPAHVHADAGRAQVERLLECLVAVVVDALHEDLVVLDRDLHATRALRARRQQQRAGDDGRQPP